MGWRWWRDGDRQRHRNLPLRRARAFFRYRRPGFIPFLPQALADGETMTVVITLGYARVPAAIGFAVLRPAVRHRQDRVPYRVHAVITRPWRACTWAGWRC